MLLLRVEQPDSCWFEKFSSFSFFFTLVGCCWSLFRAIICGSEQSIRPRQLQLPLAETSLECLCMSRGAHNGHQGTHLRATCTHTRANRCIQAHAQDHQLTHAPTHMGSDTCILYLQGQLHKQDSVKHKYLFVYDLYPLVISAKEVMFSLVLVCLQKYTRTTGWITTTLGGGSGMIYERTC